MIIKTKFKIYHSDCYFSLLEKLRNNKIYVCNVFYNLLVDYYFCVKSLFSVNCFIRYG